jgi:DNA-binding protein YbaB
MDAVQDANVNGAYVQVSVDKIDGVDNVALFDAVTEAVNAVVKRYEEQLDKDIEYTAYIFDEQGNAIY